MLRTLDVHPSYLSHIQSFETSYPRFDQWEIGHLDDCWWDLYNDHFYAWLNTLDDGDERERMAAAYEEGDLSIRSEVADGLDEAAAASTWNWIDHKQARGWMDRGPDGDAPRTDGGCALLDLVSRCPRLSTLKLSHFDLGDVDDFEDHFPASLRAIRTLILRESGRPNYTGVLLELTPNLEILDIDTIPAFMTNPDNSYLLPHLSTLRLASVLTAGTLPAVTSVVTLNRQSLRHFSLHYSNKIASSSIVALLSLVPHLEMLAIKGPDGGGTQPAPLAELLYFLRTHKSLMSLHVFFFLTSALVDHLPTPLVRLSTTAPRQEDYFVMVEVQAMTVALAKSKTSRTPLLSHARVEGVAKGAVRFLNLEGQSGQVETAKRAGLSIEFCTLPNLFGKYNY